MIPQPKAPAFNPFLLLGRWLEPSLDARRRLAVTRALCDFNVMEVPPGSNRGATIDQYNEAAGGRDGDPYCASSLTAWYRDAGLETPPMDPDWWIDKKLPYLPPCSCDAWWRWGTVTHRITHDPTPGDAVVYGSTVERNGKMVIDANHIGILIRRTPLLVTLEANTSADGKFNREGFCFDRKFIERTNTRLLGFLSPYPLAA